MSDTSPRLRIIDPLGERPLAAGDFPLTVGGTGADVVVPGAAPGEVLARVLRAGPGFRVEARAAAARDLPPGANVELGSARLACEADADGITLRVGHDGVSPRTLPPLEAGGAPVAGAEAGDRLPIEVVAYSPPAAGGRRRAARRRAWPLAAAAAAILVVAAIMLLAASVAVSVRTAPEVDAPRVDFAGSALELPLGDRWLVLPGEYRLEVRAEGYAPAAMQVAVERGAANDFVVPLERLPGRVRFDTGGVAAALTVDGTELGSVPGEHELPAGARAVRIVAERHEPWTAEVIVEGGGELQDLRVALVPSYAAVSVRSVPAGARVLVDGRELGVTPLETTLDAGRHQLELRHPDYRRFETPVTVKAGEPLVIGPVELGVPDGTLAVSSSPAGADVSVGGRYRGRTPLRVALAPGVPHEVVVSRAGHAPATRTVSVASRETAALSLALEPVLGELTLRGEPADAELYVNGERRGPANQTLRLPSAPQQIEVRKAGLAPFRSTVTPRPGQPQVIEFALASPEAARAARLASSIRASTGQELRLVRGGRFVMGSARREPGRRSNEAQRTVALERPFYIGVHEVTNADFRQFRAAHKSGIYKEETLDLDRQPVVRVSWQDAAAFCNWLSARDGLPPAYVGSPGALRLADPVTTGYRMPTEAEWEFAARFDGSAATRRYPWGDALPVPARSGNYADQSALYLSPVVITGYDDGHRVSAPVGSFPANPLGLHDLGGNVMEWTSDRYTIYVTGSDEVATDPVGPREGETWTVRGSSWLTGRTPDLRLAWRDAGAGGSPDLGFRIARYAE